PEVYTLSLHDALPISHVVGHGFIERGFGVGELVRDSVGYALGEQGRRVELEQVLLHHAAHQVRYVGGVDPVAELPLEAVAVEERSEEHTSELQSLAYL